ncbi:MAG: MBL fold metallo-hydrolase [Planctomycetaceae bacterium]|nr:MBL fold metallo-hydrolase [Planctomycetaceae bacterium]
MSVRFWGTRGSIPTPGRQTEKFGGNTTCVEVRHEDTIIVLDAGSGIREMSLAWLKEFGKSPIHATLLFTHYHWDHLQGFPFFTTAYMPTNTLDIYGNPPDGSSLEEILSGQMQGAYFPVPLAAMQATMNFHPVSQEFTIGKVKIKTFGLPHPGGCIGYRLEVDNSIFVFATDSEFDQVALNPEEIKANFVAPRKYAPELIEFFEGAHLLAIDCQYSDADYQSKVGWGHNSLATVVDLARQAQPKMLALCHHDPQSSDETVMQLIAEARLRVRDLADPQNPSNIPITFGAREGQRLAVQPPLFPLRWEGRHGESPTV